jgi:hypothetical protein
MARKVKRPLTQCGLYGSRAKVIGRDGNTLTYRWPCGYERTETLMHGPGRLRKPADLSVVAFFSRYWSDGVTYECPRCRRKALRVAREAKQK